MLSAAAQYFYFSKSMEDCQNQSQLASVAVLHMSPKFHNYGLIAFGIHVFLFVGIKC